MTTGERIQIMRKNTGLSQEQLADILGVSRQAVSKWETDQSSPDIDNILALSKAFSVSADELLGNNTDKTHAASPSIGDMLKLNMKKRYFTAGWITVLAGMLLLVAEFFSLIALQNSDKQILHQWQTNAMDYAGQPPMPTIFTITAIIILVGIGLVIAGLIRKRK